MLIAGFGSIGRRHFRNLREIGIEQFVFYRTRRGTIEDDEAAGYPAETDLEAVWKHRPGLAVISNPTADHLPVALAAARHDCDLLIEKPLSGSLEGCEELADEVASRGLVAIVGCQFRFHPLLLTLREKLNAGALGTVLGARAEWGEYLPAWHPWEDHRQSYSARADMGGGVILTLIHPLDYLYWLFGQVDRVQCATRAAPSLQTPAGEDWADITLSFHSGAIAQVHLDYVQRPPVHRLSIWGEAGRAELDFHTGRLNWQMADSSPARVDQTPEGFERNTMFLNELRQWLACCRDRRQSPIPLEDGIAVLKIALEAKQQSALRACHA